MPTVHEVELPEVLSQLPGLVPLSPKRLVAAKTDLFLCALGFEKDRCGAVASVLARTKPKACRLGVFFEYATNPEDNEKNRPALVDTLMIFCESIQPMPCDDSEFTARLRGLIESVCELEQLPRVIFDISVCSAKLILLATKVLLEYNVDLTITYAEAVIYHPKREEVLTNAFRDNPDNWPNQSALSQGVSSIEPSSEHPGSRGENLPDAVIVYPTFKPERTRAVLTDIDESLRTDSNDRVIWIVGEPRRKEDKWRTKAMMRINNIGEKSQIWAASMFEYKQSMEVLERIFRERDLKYHLTIMPLGSKLQCVAVALFWQIRQEVSIVFAVPQTYNAHRYTEGCGSKWMLEFGPVRTLHTLLGRIGQLEVVS